VCEPFETKFSQISEESESLEIKSKDIKIIEKED
jgi:hypothetical protein